MKTVQATPEGMKLRLALLHLTNAISAQDRLDVAHTSRRRALKQKVGDELTALAKLLEEVVVEES